MILFAYLQNWPFSTAPRSSKSLCYNYVYVFQYLKIWFLFCFHGSLDFSLPAKFPVVEFLQDLGLLFSISIMCFLYLLLKIWIMTHSPSGLIVINLLGWFCELSHLVGNSNENTPNEESLEQEIADYLFFRIHDMLANAFLGIKSQILE